MKQGTNLETLLGEVEGYRRVLKNHNNIPCYEMLPCLRMYRTEIVSSNGLQKGEFTKLFRHCKEVDKLNNCIKSYVEDDHDVQEILAGREDNLYSPNSTLVKEVKNRNYDILNFHNNRFNNIANEYRISENELKVKLLDYQLGSLKNTVN